jgi:hypothetical protein
MMQRAWLFCALLVAGCRGSADADSICQEVAFPLAVYAGSRLRSDGGIDLGERVACSSVPSLFAGLGRALERAPEHLRPLRVTLHLRPELPRDAPPVSGVEVHRPSGSLLLGNEAEVPTPSIWLHELAHLRMSGTRPRGALAARLFRALEEGVADYYAALLSGSSRIGAAAEERDLAHPPVLGASHWAKLAVPRAFDDHDFGWNLASRLFREAPRDLALLQDLVTALAVNDPWPATAETPQASLAEFVRRCPPRSRDAIQRLLASWVPSEIYRG